MKSVDFLATILVIVGALNWGLVGAFDLNLVTALFGVGSALSSVVFILVGLAAVYFVARWATGHHHAQIVHA